LPLDNAAMHDGELSTKKAPMPFSTAASPSENKVTITTASVHTPFPSSMKDCHSTRYILFARVIMEFDIPIPPELCKYEPLSINYAHIHHNHGHAY
jgi:hypothetical protein